MSQTPPSLPPKTPEYSAGHDASTQPQAQPQPRPVPKVKISGEIQSLPKDQLVKLISSIDVLKGYLITLNENDTERNSQQLDNIIKDIQRFINTLQHLESSKADLNKNLGSLQSLASEWNSKEVEMYASLKRFNAESLYSQLRSSMVESKKLSETISQSFIQETQLHDEASIQNFIKTYKSERKLYYLRNEKLHRFEEDRIGGLL